MQQDKSQPRVSLAGNRETIMEISLLSENISRVLHQHDSGEPGSFGVRLFRSRLLLRMALREGSILQADLDEARHLLELDAQAFKAGLIA